MNDLVARAIEQAYQTVVNGAGKDNTIQQLETLQSNVRMYSTTEAELAQVQEAQAEIGKIIEIARANSYHFWQSGVSSAIKRAYPQLGRS